MIRRLYHHNAWANARVFEVCLGLPAALLDEEARGTSGTIARTLKHLVAVEDVYLAMLRAGGPEAVGSMEEYLAHDVAWFAGRSAELGEAYLAWLAACDRPALERDLQIPWFDFPVTGEEGLLQVLSHSSQHRAQVLSVLGARGISVPELDYVLMLAEERSRRPTPGRAPGP